MRTRSCLFSILLLSLLAGPVVVRAQSGNSNSHLTLDVGITRGRNVNLWPLYKKYRDTTRSETEVLFPLYASRKNYITHTRSVRLLPFMVSDSSMNGIDRRFLSFYYPSLVHFHKTYTPSGKASYFRFMEFAPGISLMSVGRDQRGLLMENNLLFFVWYKRDTVKQKTSLTVFPVYHYSTTPHDTVHAVFPLFYKKSDFTGYRLNLLGLYNQQKYQRGRSASLFPLAWHREHYYSYDTTRRNVLFPVYWDYKSKYRHNRVIFPLVFSLHDEYRNSFTFFPLFSYSSHNKEKEKRLAVTPLFWHTETAGGKRNVLFPLVWERKEYKLHDTLDHLTLFPLYWGLHGSHERHDVLFPLIYSSDDKNMRSLTFFPLFTYQHAHDGSLNRLAVTPLFWHTETSSGSKTLLLPFFYTQKDYLKQDTIRTIKVFPFYYATRSRQGSSDIFLPFIYSKKDTDTRSITVLPLFSYQHRYDSTLTRLAVTPLFWHTQGENSTRNVLFPIVWDHKQYTQTDTIRKTAVLPFVWSVKSSQKQNTFVFPFVYSLNDAEKRSLTVFPLFSYGKMRDSSGGHLGIAPIYWHSQTRLNSYTAVFPFWWKHEEFHKQDTITRKTVFPLYWSLDTRKQHNRVLFPLVYSLRNDQQRSLTVFPLYYHEAKDSTLLRTAITPLFWHSRTVLTQQRIVDGKAIFYRDTTTRNRLLPLYYSTRSSRQRNDVFFPLVWSSRQYRKNDTVRQTTVLPFFFTYSDSVKRSVTFIPLFSSTHYSDGTFSRLGITPLFWRSQEVAKRYRIVNGKPVFYADTTTRIKVLPLYYGSRSDGQRNDVLFPILFSSQEGLDRHLTIFPLYHHTRLDSTFERYMITPLCWHSRRVEEQYKNVNGKYSVVARDTVLRTSVLPFFYTYHSAESDKILLLPFIFSSRDKEQRSLTFFPLFTSTRYSDSSYSRLAITPLYWHTRDRKGTTDLFFPLAYASREFRKDDTIRHINIFPLYYSLRSKNEQRDVFLPFIFTHKDPVSRSVTVLPLFSYRKDEARQFKQLAVTPLFWHTETMRSQKNRRVTNVLFPLVWNKKRILWDDTTSTTYIFPFIFSSHGKNHSNQVIFPLVWRLKNENKRSFTLFPLFTTGRSSDNKYRHTMVTPLAGFFRTPKKTTAFVLPLLFYKKENGITSYSLLGFLYRHSERPGFSRTSFLWPLCERTKTATRSSFRFAPLIWFSRTDSSRMSSIQPFYYAYRNKEKSQFVLGPYLYRHEKVNGVSVSNSFLLRLFYTKRYTNGDHETRFLHLVYANVNVDGKKEKSILPFYHMTSDSSGNSSRSAFFGFYTHFRQYKPEIKDYYEEIEIFWFMRLRSNYQELKSQGKTGFTRKRR